jgi:ribonucleotide reductase beta subunit family protein with ferritin-like domain
MSVAKAVQDLRAALVQTSPPEDRFNLFPLQNERLYELYKSLESSEWVVGELSFSKDLTDYNQRLTEEERVLVRRIFGFFAVGDSLIIDNVAVRFLIEATSMEEKFILVEQLKTEIVHAETYSLINATLVTDPNEFKKICLAFQDDPATKAKTDWLEKYMQSDLTQAERYAAFCCAEILFFSSLFCIIFWFKSRGLLHNITDANRMIAQDESMHGLVNSVLSKHYEERTGVRVSDEFVASMVTDAVQIESAYIRSVLTINRKDFNGDLVVQYVQYVGDFILAMLNRPKIWNVTNPFNFMVTLGMMEKPNFYERNSTNYRKYNAKNVIQQRRDLGTNSKDIKEDAYVDPSNVDF